MLHFAVGLYNSLFSVPEYRILIIGHEGSGKSVLMEQLKYMYHPNNSSNGEAPAPAAAAAPSLSSTGTSGAPPASSPAENDSAEALRARLQSTLNSVATASNGAALHSSGEQETPPGRAVLPAGTPLPAPPSYLAAKRIRPTVGMNYAKILHRYAPLPVRGDGPSAAAPPPPPGQRHLIMWDLGGAPSLRTLWTNYYPQCQAIIYVVDATSADAVGNRRTLESVLLHPQLQGVPILVLANKIDVPEHASLAALQESLSLADLAVKASFYQQDSHAPGTGASDPPSTGPVSAATGSGVKETAAPAVAEAIGTSGFGHVVMRLMEGSAMHGTGLCVALDWLVAQLERGAREVEHDDGK